MGALLRVVVVVVAAGGALAGCNHVESKLPGVLDLRSDGTSAAVETRALKAKPRDGMDGALGGEGAIGDSDVTIRARQWWALRLFAMGDATLGEDLRGVLGKGGALRRVHVGEEISAFEAAAFFCGLPIPCVDIPVLLFMPTMTLTAAGTRLAPPAPKVAPPVAPPTPTPPLDRPPLAEEKPR